MRGIIYRAWCISDLKQLKVFSYLLEELKQFYFFQCFDNAIVYRWMCGVWFTRHCSPASAVGIRSMDCASGMCTYFDLVAFSILKCVRDLKFPKLSYQLINVSSVLIVIRKKVEWWLGWGGEEGLLRSEDGFPVSERVGGMGHQMLLSGTTFISGRILGSL